MVESTSKPFTNYDAVCVVHREVFRRAVGQNHNLLNRVHTGDTFGEFLVKHSGCHLRLVPDTTDYCVECCAVQDPHPGPGVAVRVPGVLHRSDCPTQPQPPPPSERVEQAAALFSRKQWWEDGTDDVLLADQECHR